MCLIASTILNDLWQRWPQAAMAAILLLLHGCASLPPGSGTPKSPSGAFSHPEDTPLGRQFCRAAKEHAEDSGFLLINTGFNGLLARLEIARKARHTLDLQYYIFRGDASGLRLADALLHAADRGVRVRILVDDGDTDARDDQLRILTAHPNIEFRVFNPFSYRGHSNALRAIEFAFNKPRLDYRMHNKLFVADNAVALIGGRNIGDAYFQVDPLSQLGDDDLFMVGPMVKQLSVTFDDFWNSALAIPVNALTNKRPSAAILARFRKKLEEQRRSFNYAARLSAGEPLEGIFSGRLRLIWAPAQLVYDSPEKRRVEKGELPGQLMQRTVNKALRSVRHELLVMSPFFVPGEDGMAVFRVLRDRNVDIQILTNSLNSTHVLAAQAGYMHYRLALLEEGARLFEIKATLGNSMGSGETRKMAGYGTYGLHGKMLVFDRKSVYIGSMNLDQRSEKLNTEIGLIIDSPELANQVARRFEELTGPENAYRLLLRDENGRPELIWQTREGGKIVNYDTEPALSEWRKFKVDLLSHLPLDGEL